MNILVVGKFYTEGFAQHIAETLVFMGHSVLRHQPGLSYSTSTNSFIRTVNKVKSSLFDIYTKTPQYHNSIKKQLLKFADKKDINLTIVCHDFLTPEQVDALRKKTNSPVVLWFPDHIGAFGKSMFLNSLYDYLFFKDPYIVFTLRDELKKPAYYLPECCNPEYHKKVDLDDKDLQKYGCEISTAGNLHANRIALFEHLTGYNIKIWGHQPPFWAITSNINQMIKNEFVVNEEKSKSFIASKIVINNLQPSEIIGINVRAFEIAAAGAFQLINWRPGINQLYSVEEIVCYKNIDELKELINYYLHHDSERKTIAEKAWIRTHRDHTYQKRLSLMIDTIFNNKKGYDILNNYYR